MRFALAGNGYENAVVSELCESSKIGRCRTLTGTVSDEDGKELGTIKVVETEGCNNYVSQLQAETAEKELELYAEYGIEPIPLSMSLPPIPLVYSEDDCPPVLCGMIDAYNGTIPEIWKALADWLEARSLFYKYQAELVRRGLSWEERCSLVDKYDRDVLKEHVVRDSVTTPFYKVRRAIQAEVRRGAREGMGLGGKWVRERYLLDLVRRLRPQETVYFRYRPIFLEGLELDVFIPGMRVGFEHQGRQHYEPVEYFGGEEAFLKVRERDRRKRRLCKENGVRLIEVTYKEELTEESIRSKLGRLAESI